MADHVVIHLRGGQTVRLPLRPRGRGTERPPVGYEELETWLDKRSDVVKYDPAAIDFVHVEAAGTTPGGTP